MTDTRTDASETEKGAFSAEERAAMKERAAEVKKARRGSKADPEPEVLAKIAEMPEADRVLAEGIHALVKEHAPHLTPRTWYGMPAYAKDGKVLVFFQAAEKFGTRYATIGFNDVATLDDGTMWPVSYALTAMTDAERTRIGELLRRAAG
ncbi:hypothetical protein GC089_01570 [Cellulomonas sp. JZ18]|uniref:iron chaperone n=1 Tax=Cellulomonas sp. JZ18 TaxID=2654191 RepID=UPI0012D3E223|nr:hypothetical protein [Cellulomonas sp. JZ18]QGQ18196.1 hypothetical protein GC089_01570 [Cellulomonas sp. JZ18]